MIQNLTVHQSQTNLFEMESAFKIEELVKEGFFVLSENFLTIQRVLFLLEDNSSGTAFAFFLDLVDVEG